MSTDFQETEYKGRRRVIVGIFLMLAVVLSARAVQLQLADREFLQDHGQARYLRVAEIPAHRGIITDRHGEPLAISTPVDSVWAVPDKLFLNQGSWSELAEILETNPEHLKMVIEPRRRREFVYLKRHVPPDVALRVRQLGVPGVRLEREYRRYYPAGEVTGHVIGFTNVDDIGQEGVELLMDSVLRGEPGAKRVIKDRLGRVIEDVESIETSRPGREVALSIDKRIQYLAYRELKRGVQLHEAKGGSAIVVDATNGHILAMVNQPSYNPNNRSKLKRGHYRNRAATDAFEPGSTAKPFTIAAALESGMFAPATQVNTTPGHFAVGRHMVRDMKNYGLLDVTGVIEKSSNVGVSKIALALEPELLWQTFRELGFGSLTDIGLPGESGGRLNHFSNWHEIEHATLAFGYGFSVSALQLTQAYTVLANDGMFIPLTIFADNKVVEARRVLSVDTAKAVRVMLENAVEQGTGRSARVTGYRVAGKTGTVHRTSSTGYAEDRYIALFAGLAPVSQPRIVAIIMIDEPRGSEYFGGRVAAPVFGKIMEEALRLLNIPPDRLDQLASSKMALNAASREPHQ